MICLLNEFKIGKHYYFNCFCNETKRYGKIRKDQVKKGNANSRKFPIRPFEECESVNEFLQQFPWKLNQNGYLACKTRAFDPSGPQKWVYYHNLVWECENGPIPEGLTVDHIDRCRTNNSIENLRLATLTQQHINKSHARRSKYGRFIQKTPNGRAYYARIQTSGGGNWQSKLCSSVEEACAERDKRLRETKDEERLQALKIDAL